MASRIWCVVLIWPLCALPLQGVAQTVEGISAGEEAALDPRIERRRVKEAAIDAENFEVGAYAGLISLEDFGVSNLVGARVGYHVSEDVFFEVSVASARAERSSFEELALVNLLDEEDRKFLSWHLDVAYQLLPGEAFLGTRRAFNTGLYLVGGAGSTRFGGDDHFTLNVGMGYRVLLSDWLSLRLETRDYIYEIDTFGSDQVGNNLAWTVGIGGFF